MSAWVEDEGEDLEIRQDISLDFDLLAVVDSLTNDQAFIAGLRNMILKDARGKGNSYGKYAQRDRLQPTQQPNTKQRIF